MLAWSFSGRFFCFFLILILQMRKSKLKEVKKLIQSHMASKSLYYISQVELTAVTTPKF